jgi:hypothetical protein
MGTKLRSLAAGLGGLQEKARAVVRFVTRSRATDSEPRVMEQSQQEESISAASGTTPRTIRRQTDIGLDVLSNTYTPPRTSSKASFRSTGADHQQDQEFATGVSDSRWNDEDRYTNKSGDPRIGTHGRTYEPAASRDESRD